MINAQDLIERAQYRTHIILTASYKSIYLWGIDRSEHSEGRDPEWCSLAAPSSLSALAAFPASQRPVFAPYSRHNWSLPRESKLDHL